MSLIAVLVLAVLQEAGTEGREIVLASNEPQEYQAADRPVQDRDVPTSAQMDTNPNIQDP